MALIQCNFFSEALGLNTTMNVLLPQKSAGQIGMNSTSSDEPPAVLYLLHGLSDDHTTWMRRTAIERYAAAYPLAIVMPAVHRSFYADMVYGGNYWTFVSEELPQIVQSFFQISNDWKKTFVAGLSMGGYGAFKLGLSQPERFAAAASLSGCLDINRSSKERVATGQEEYLSVFGQLDSLPGSNNDLLALVEKFPSIGKTKFYQCCGTDDFLYQDNLTFRDHAAEKLDLIYEEHGGESHEWGYWDQQIQRVLEWLPLESK